MDNYRQIKGFEGKYKISENGLILSLKKTVKCAGGKTRVIPQKQITPFMTNHGYLAVDLVQISGGRKIRKYIHRLVYENFIGEIPDGMVINHIDNNGLNNSFDNLECVTQRDNVRHYFKNKNGKVGVFFDKPQRGKRKYRASIWHNGRVDLGRHETKEDAEKAVKEYIGKNLNYVKYR